MINPNATHNKIIGATTGSILALGALTSCSTLGAEEVRGIGWVNTVEPVELKFVGGRSKDTSCVVKDGSKIKINRSTNTAKVVIADAPLGITGTSCPEGTNFFMTPELYSDLDRAKSKSSTLKQNAKEAKKLSDKTGDPTSISGWFETVNEPYQTYRSINNVDGKYQSKMEFGDSCLVDESTPVSLLGQLSTGDYAARVEEKLGLGTPCPEGAIVIVPRNDIDK